MKNGLLSWTDVSIATSVLVSVAVAVSWVESGFEQPAADIANTVDSASDSWGFIDLIPQKCLKATG